MSVLVKGSGELVERLDCRVNYLLANVYTEPGSPYGVLRCTELDVEYKSNIRNIKFHLYADL